MKHRYFWMLLPIVVLLLTGFNLDKAIIPKDEILSGGVPKDGIPALFDPKLVTVEQADFLDKDDQVIAVTIAGESKAYPVKILNWHEIVNDSVGSKNIAVTF